MSLLDDSRRHMICKFLYITDPFSSAAVDHHLSMSSIYSILLVPSTLSLSFA